MFKNYKLNAFIGIVFIAIAISHAYDQIQFLVTSDQVTLEVVEVESKTDSDGTTYRPVFEMTTVDGSKIRYAGNLWSYPPAHEKGEIVPGRYVPATGEMQSDALTDDHTFFAGMFAFGGILATFSSVIGWRRYG